MHYQVSRKLSIAGAVVPCDRCFLFVYVHDCRDHNRPIKEAKVDLFLYRSQKNLGLVSQSGGLFATKMTAVNGGCYFELTAGFDGYLEVRGPGLRPVELLMKDFAWVAVADMRQGEERKIFLTMIDDDAPAPADLDETVTRYLDSVDVVRVRVEYATNLGHQSAALAMIARLRDIGYAGLIQALVSNRDPKEEGEVSVAEKLRKLRPDFPDTGDLDVTWLRDSGSGEFDSPPASGVSALGMIGAIDAKVGAFQSYRINTLKVPAALFLQPFNWHEGQRAICTEQIEKTACLPSTSTYLLDVHACDTAALCRAAGLEGAADDLLAILESARSAVELMVAYGLARGEAIQLPKWYCAICCAAYSPRKKPTRPLCSSCTKMTTWPTP